MTDNDSAGMIKPQPQSGYMPQLDTLRTFAVLLVLLEHWLPAGHGFKILPYGMIGVTLFFVLSGFLITQILMKSRDYSESLKENKSHSIKQFYIRRTLRIFPVYYVTIFILYILNFQNIRDKILWYLFYASNIYFFEMQEWDGYLSHFWTLAVEEQFYIIWPFVILFIPRKYLFKSIIAIILTGPVFRTILYMFSDGTEVTSNFIHILTPSCMDCFGLGALLAYYRMYVSDTFGIKNKGLAILVGLCIISILILLMFEENIISVFFFRLNVSVICFYLISKASIGFKGMLKYVFENKVLMYLGKISYGLYLFHKFIPLIYKSMDLPAIYNVWLNFIVQSALLVLIASVSWFILEKPINNLKKYFAYN